MRRKNREDRRGTETQEPLDRHDLPAMMCSAYLVLMPVCIVAILAICLIAYFIFIH